MVLTTLGQFDSNAWYPPLRQAVEGLTADLAKWRPAPSEHCIWDHVSHITTWTEELASRLAGNPRRRELYESDETSWPGPEGQGLDADWRKSVIRLAEAHTRLVAAAEALDDEAVARGGPGSPADKIIGCVAHEAYHGSQIVLLRRLRGVWEFPGEAG
jgi:hypothetical protein